MKWVLLNLGKAGLNTLISCEHISWAKMVKTLTEELSGVVITATAATAPRQHHHLIRMRLTARTAIHQHWHVCYLIPCEGFPMPSYRPRTQANQTDRVITATYLLENKATHVTPFVTHMRGYFVRTNTCHYLLEPICPIFTIWSLEALKGKAMVLHSQSACLYGEKHMKMREGNRNPGMFLQEPI